jgi:hypothetical protein
MNLLNQTDEKRPRVDVAYLKPSVGVVLIIRSGSYIWPGAA